MVTIFVILLFGFFSYKKGFAFTVVSLLCFGAAFIGALILSSICTEIIYEAFLKNSLYKIISEAVGSSGDTEAMLAELNTAIKTLPAFIANMLEFETGGLLYEMGKAVESNKEAVSTEILTLISPVVKMAVRGISFIILFLLCRIVLGIVAHVFKFVRKIPILGMLDGFLGGILGTAQGALFVFIAGNILMFVIKISNNSLNMISLENISDTTVFMTIISLGQNLNV